MKIGVIAEETNDIEVMYYLTSKLIGEKSFSFKRFVGHGCGKLRRKCGAWASDLVKKGCSFVIIIHDLDNQKTTELKRTLSNSLSAVSGLDYLILIPTREMEAWLLSDASALKEAFSLRSLPAIPHNPESLTDAKKTLQKIIEKYDKTYTNTIHNKKIAEKISISCLKKCKSFLPYPEFISERIKAS